MAGRKEDHLRICAKEDVETSDPGFWRIRLAHRASPEISLDEVSTKVRFLGKTLGFPLIFEAITGGTAEAEKINRTLAKVAQEFGLGMGVGSQRAAIEDPKLARTYQVRDVAPEILLIGNIGAAQLNLGWGLKECERAVAMIGADALALHLNPLQEAIQPEGNTDFNGVIRKVNAVAKGLSVPVIAKEVGSGLDIRTARKLKVAALDVAGAGGTSWSLVESFRNQDLMGSVGVAYSEWGIPTVEAVESLSKLKTPLIASGGIRSGLDAAKSIALGADVAGVALPALRAYYGGGEDALRAYVKKFILEFRIAMYLTGSKRVGQLRGKVE
jgi:isopentenyl-diphosphate Delta-isomerase